MKKVISVLAVFIIIFTASMALTGCRESTRVSHNVSQEADNFNVIRRLMVINGRTDELVFELIGAFSFELQETNGNKRIIAIVETGPNEYKKHSIGLPHEAFWFVEDLSGAEVDKYRYEVNFLPEMIIPIIITSDD